MEPVLCERNARGYIAWYCLKAFMNSVKKKLLLEFYQLTNVCYVPWTLISTSGPSLQRMLSTVLLQPLPHLQFAYPFSLVAQVKVYYTVWNMQYNHICQMKFYNRVQKASYLRGLWEGFQTGKLKVRSCLLPIYLKWKKSALGFQHGRWLDICTVS